ncbi:hypothetical protein [Halosimplex halophilum]|uniref:hypothetical protein n=1 Tax=Halosimplex halophilum TaxID=2559572 RepID=UPI00107F65A0|nr:hypothetical protein [Halosimplex halophilum]
MTGTVQSVVTEPGETLDRFSDLSRYERLIENADDIPGLLVQQYQRQQRTANPYYRQGEVANEQLYDDFRRGYYSGLVVFEVALSAAGGQVKNVDKVQDLADRARATRAVRYYRSARTRFVSAPVSRLGSKVTRRVVDRVDVDAPGTVRETMAGIETVGRSWSLSRRLGTTPSDVLRGLSDRGRSQLRAYYRGIRGTRGGSDTGLEVLTDGGRAEFREALNDRAISGRTLAQFRRGSSDRTWRELLDRDVCNSPCESTIRSVYQYTKDADGLDNDEAKDLLNAYAEADEVSIGPGSRGSATVQQRIDDLDGENVDGVVRSMRGVSAGKTGYKRIAGETRIADDALEQATVSSGDVELSNDIPRSEVPDSLTKDSSEIDVDVKSEITIDGDTVDSPAIESKNLNPGPYSESFIEQVWTERVSAKFAAQAAAGEDEIVLVVPDEFKTRFGDELDAIPDKVERRLSNNGVSADPTVRITTYDGVGA